MCEPELVLQHARFYRTRLQGLNRALRYIADASSIRFLDCANHRAIVEQHDQRLQLRDCVDLRAFVSQDCRILRRSLPAPYTEP